MCIFVTSCVFLYRVCIALLHNLVVGLLARSQYSEGPATGHLDTGFSRFPCVYKQTLRRFPTFQVATTCFSCSFPDLRLLDPYFIIMLSLFHMHLRTCIIPTATGWQDFVVKYNIIIIIIIIIIILLTWRIWWAPNNASRRQMGFNLAFRWLNFSEREFLG